jgi:hypothetical protein
MEVGCPGRLRERILATDPENPYRCDTCGARFDRKQNYVAGHGQPGSQDGLNMRLDHGPCRCPEHG